MQVAHFEILVEMLFSSAVAFEHIEEPDDYKIRTDCVDLRVPAVKMVCDDIARWF